MKRDELRQMIEALPDILTIGEVAMLLRVTHRTIRNYISNGQLEAYRAGVTYRITKSALKRFLRIPDD